MMAAPGRPRILPQNPRHLCNHLHCFPLGARRIPVGQVVSTRDTLPLRQLLDYVRGLLLA